MGLVAALKTVSFYNTLKSTALALAGDMDLVPDLYKLGKLDFLTKLIGSGIRDLEFPYMIKSALAL
jgi:hypothetical protein